MNKLKQILKTLFFTTFKNRIIVYNYNNEQDLENDLYSGYPEKSIRNKRFYNIGAGDWSHSYWTNIDQYVGPYKRPSKGNIIFHDLMAGKPLPIDDNTAEIIYISHTIEHIDNVSALNLFRSSLKKLKKGGGGIRITAPDAKLMYNNLIEDDKLFFNNYSQHKSIVQQYLQKTATAISGLTDSNDHPKLTDREFWDIINENGFDEGMDIICNKCSIDEQAQNPSNHINWWTTKKVKKYLKEAGFCNIYETRFGQSKMLPLRNLRYFDITHPEMSFYLEAIKD